MSAYATVEDVEARTTRSFTAAEEDVIEALLADAALLIDACNSDAGDDVKKVVSCRMVVRAMGDGSDYGVPIGATQGSMAAGGYTQSWTISSGVSGELYLSKTDKAMLGVSRRLGAYSPLEGMVVPCD